MSSFACLSHLLLAGSLAGLAACAARGAAETPPLRPGLVLTTSARFPGGEVLLPDSHEDGTGGAIVVRGDNLTVDFGGATLRGTPETAEPDQRAGTGLLVTGRNVTLRNVHVRGFKIGLLARRAPGLKVLDSDFSYNWKQHLRSTPAREDESDWMSYHHNEADEWLRYGAGMSLSDCDGFEVRGCHVTGGQCGLMLTRCRNGLIWNNDFSFLSAIGVGLYRSEANRVMHNRIDWCVRGYSHGVYNRGQDSAGILVFEQSSRNTFAYNSVTHGGDGFFLWAGQTTMDTGMGGCNDNLLYGNDFSHAPTNGIELTFSRNRIIHNLVLECWHGVWGGYSYDSLFARNVFGFNVESVAIEHGQDNRFVGNTFYREHTGIRLWQNAQQDPNWGYPKHHDTRSHDYLVAGNRFDSIDGSALDIRRTAGVRLEDNHYVHLGAPAVASDSETTGLISDAPKAATDDRPLSPTIGRDGRALLAAEQDTGAYLARFREVKWNPWAPDDPDAPAPLPGGQKPFLATGALRGRRFILVGEWGPYDFRSPLLVRREPVPGRPRTLRFDVLGPKGAWRLISPSGAASVSATTGKVPGMLIVTLPEGAASAAPENLDLRLEYRGAATTDYRGIVTPAGKPVAFGYRSPAAPAPPAH